MGFVTALRSASAAWPDEFWAGSVGWADAMLRSYYGIYEFTDDPDCVLRVGLDQARAPASLSDGTRVEAGELVGTLAFLERAPAPLFGEGPRSRLGMRGAGPGHLLAARIVGIHRARAELARRCGPFAPKRLGRRGSGLAQIRRVFQRYGFERVPTDCSFLARLHGLGECFVLWGLTRAFNPAACRASHSSGIATNCGFPERRW